jgi:hypothetical protein
MNARERRQIERRFSEKVALRYTHVGPASDEFDDEVRAWCNKTIGRKNWMRDSGHWYSRLYFFTKPEHTVWFKLRWL